MSRIRGFEFVSSEQWEKDIEGLKHENSYNQQDVRLPRRATARSAGYDIFSPIDFELFPGEEIKIPLGFKIYMLEDECFKIIPRSGLGFKYYLRLANETGLIDSDYYNNSGNEGHCWIKLRNEGTAFLMVKRMDAIAQGTFERILLADGDCFDGLIRGGGLGSTS